MDRSLTALKRRSYLRWSHIRIGQDVAIALKALALALARGLHPFAEGSRRFAQPLIRELLILHAGYLNVDIDAVQEGAGDAFLVTADHGVRAGALLHRIAVPTAGAGIVTKPHISLSLRRPPTSRASMSGA
jgi:hypothetical protein